MNNQEKRRAIQLIELEILKECVRICDKHNLKYFLTCGTMLGAVRHKGFIPWDDDIDISMLWSDYKKFLKYARKEISSQYYIQCVKTDPKTCYLYTKIRKNGTRMLMPTEEYSENKHQGIWIDIFPMIGAADSEYIRLKQIKILRHLQNMRFQHPSFSGKRGIKELLKKVWNLGMCIEESLLWGVIDLFQSKNTKEICTIATNLMPYWEENAWKAGILDRKFFKESALYEFEDSYFKGSKLYNEYLIRVYGEDYMTPRKKSHLEDYSGVVL